MESCGFNVFRCSFFASEKENNRDYEQSQSFYDPCKMGEAMPN